MVPTTTRRVPLLALVAAALLGGCAAPAADPATDRASGAAASPPEGSSASSSASSSEGSPTVVAERQRPFVAVEYDPYREDGTGVVTGQAFLKTRGGDVKFGAGNVVHLVPATSYSSEWFEREVRGSERLEPRDPRAAHYHWTTRADGFGGFTFERLPAGNYYLACRITWEIADPEADRGTTTSGGWAWAKVAVRDGEDARAIVTR